MITASSPLLVASARTALKLALLDLDLEPTKTILVPEFICDVLLEPIRQCGLKPRYYSTTRDLVPDWVTLEAIVVDGSCSALVMVHYFGQPQDVTQFRKFCDQHDLVLIEDNAHGHGGRIGEVPLGMFGNVGISSPRKILGLPSGGALYGAGNGARCAAEKLHPFPLYHPKVFAKRVLRSVPLIRRWIKATLDRNRHWSDPRLHREVLQSDFAIDPWSRRRIATADWENIAAKRRECWNAWAMFAQSKGWGLVFPCVHPESCPWAMPVYVKNMAERNEWLHWGAKKKIELFPWPTLPEEIVIAAGEATARWKMLLCISLEKGPEEIAQICAD